MRTFGSIIDKAVKFREPTIPNPRMARVNPPAGTRLNEGVTELFHHACAANDLEAAKELLALMEKWHERRSYGDERLRWSGATQLRRLHGELERRDITGSSRLAAAGTRFEQNMPGDHAHRW